jgi:hypothetical protein
MIKSKSEQRKKEGFIQWLRTRKFVILGIIYVVFNILISYEHIASSIKNGTDGSEGNPGVNMDMIVTLVISLPSLFIYIISVINMKENSKPAKYLLILPGVLWIITLILYWIYQQSYFHELDILFRLHLFVGGISFLYFKLPKK